MVWRGILSGIVMAAAVAGSAQTSRISFKIRPVWAGMTTANSMPYYADIENVGVDTTGTISEAKDSGGLEIRYPVELPTGSKKRVLIFSTGYGASRFQLRTRVGDISEPVEISYSNASAHYGLISDNPDDLGFMRGSSSDSSDQGGVQTGGSRPEEAPDRISAYTCLDVLVLGEGSERLTESQVSAIKAYVKSGGGLIFIGGVAKSASTDARWNDIRPVGNLKLTNEVVNGQTITELAGRPALAAKTVDFEVGKAWIGDYGLGSVGMLSVNPFEGPLRTFAGRRVMLLKTAQRNRGAAAGGYVGPYLQAANNSYSTAPGTTQADPFQIAAPSSSSLALIVALYIVAVVPINFLILRKLKKAELAWVTVPIISVIFSLVLLRSTIGLYRSTAATRTHAVVALDGQGGEGVVMARSEMFFPNADAHDLKLSSVDGTYRVRIENDYSYYGNEQTSAMNFIDNGRNLIAPECETTNLAFREFTYLQTTNALSGIRCNAMATSAGYRLILTNGSKNVLRGLTRFTQGSRLPKPIDKVEPGQTIELFVSNAELTAKPPQNGDQVLRLANGQALPVYVQFEVDGLRLGPGWGSEHPGSTLTAVIHPYGGTL